MPATLIREGYRAGVETLSRRTVRNEVLLVLGVSLGASGVFALLDLVRSLTAAKPLNQQTQTLVQSAAPGRPWLDLAFQLANIAFGLMPALLAVHLLHRDHDGPAVALGLSPRRPRFDLALVSWRARNAQTRPEVLTWNLPYEMIVVGLYED